MAIEEHLNVLTRGVEVWNQWRKDNSSVKPDLSKANLGHRFLEYVDFSDANLIKANLRAAKLHCADLRAAELRKADLSSTDLSSANLDRAYLSGANLRTANLSRASLSDAYLGGTDFRNADLRNASLYAANLSYANLSNASLKNANLFAANLSDANLGGADLEDANFNGAQLVRSDLRNAILTDCSVFGVSAWGVRLDGAEQKNLIITPYGEPVITVDNLEMAQFVYLLLNNERIRDVINTITSKVVLILGRFTPERKAILNAIREELRRRDYLPILFDVEKPDSRDITETVSTLAHMARFVIADITGAKSIPQELQSIVPNLPSVPVQPLLMVSDSEYGMFEHFKRYPWVLKTHIYNNIESLISSLVEKVIVPAELKAMELQNYTRGIPSMTKANTGDTASG
jgi:uncharacterized protein YjbI with pentapeptide repeats